MDKNKKYEPFKFWEDLRSGYFTSMIKETSKGNMLSSVQEVYIIMKPIFKQEHNAEKR